MLRKIDSPADRDAALALSEGHRLGREAAEQERDRLAERVAKLAEALKSAIEQLEGCAINHYPLDAVEQGMPAWLDDLRAALQAGARSHER